MPAALCTRWHSRPTGREESGVSNRTMERIGRPAGLATAALAAIAVGCAPADDHVDESVDDHVDESVDDHVDEPADVRGDASGESGSGASGAGEADERAAERSAPAAGERTRPAGETSFGITGLVKQPMRFDRRDLERYDAVRVRLNDVTSDGRYRGVFEHRGVPLRGLLEQARIAKGASVFGRVLDLAVVVRNRDGAAVVLSWGEIFYRNAAEVVLGYEATPRMPHKPCADCHTEEEARPWLEQLERDVPAPKLVVAHDASADRAIEGVTSIEVTDLGRDAGIFVARKDRPDDLRS